MSKKKFRRKLQEKYEVTSSKEQYVIEIYMEYYYVYLKYSR